MLLSRTTGLALAALLPACSSTDFETDACIATSIEVEDVSASRPEDLRVTARLVTEAGQPVADRILKFHVRAAGDSAASLISAGRTGRDGVTTVDLYADLGAVPLDFVNADVRAAKFMYLRYENPDAFQAANPNYCSSEATVGFRYDGPLPKTT